MGAFFRRLLTNRRFLTIFFIVVALFVIFKPLGNWLKSTIGFFFQSRYSTSASGEPVQSSMTKSEAKRVAEKLYEALLENNTEDEALFNEWFEKINNQADFNLVYQAFGVRSDNAVFKSFEGDLISAMNEYLSYDEILNPRTHASKKGFKIELVG